VGVYGAEAKLTAVALDGLQHGYINGPAGYKATSRLAIPHSGRLLGCRSLLCLQTQPVVLASLGIPFRLGWAGLHRGRRSVAVLPLVDRPAPADAQSSDGQQNDGGNEPLFHDVLHYSHKISNRVSNEGR